MDEAKLEKGNYNLSHDQDGNIVLRSTGLDVVIDKDGDYAVRFADKASPLAEGHNPDELTEEQVGVADGWRLLAADEIDHRREGSPLIECWNSSNPRLCWTWNIDFIWAGNNDESTYRTKQPAGHFRPAPAVFTVKHIDSVLTDLRLVERAISFGHPHEVIEQMICRYENLKLNA